MQEVLDFLNCLVQNNNREWFAENKDRYTACRLKFETFTAAWIERMSVLEPQLQGLRPADCIWRIYRDTRFSADKTPYKNHFGAFLAPHGGKKSAFAGYYFHLQPDACMFAAGMWCPEGDLLRKVRQSIYDNVDELEEIVENPHFQQYFQDLDTDYMLRRVPAPYPADFIHADWLKRKTFTISCGIDRQTIASDDLLERLMDICQAAKPLNDFLNYVFEE